MCGLRRSGGRRGFGGGGRRRAGGCRLGRARVLAQLRRLLLGGRGLLPRRGRIRLGFAATV